jgi:SAM-dependent methyltransferase
MTRLTDAEHVAAQYKDSSGFDARVRIYELYATNPRPWLHWLFDCLRLADKEVVLELGAGTGNVWFENRERIPEQAEIFLSDLSSGMLEQARRKLGVGQRPFHYLQCDAQQIPLAGDQVDVILANHMLYHVPNRAAAIAEAYRVLRPGGRLYVGTNDWTHLQELRELVARFEIESLLLPPGRDANFFDLENAAEELSVKFSQLRLFRRQDTLEIKETGPLLDYVRSTMSDGASPAPLSALEQHVARQINLLGSFHVGIAIGVFEAVKD